MKIGINGFGRIGRLILRAQFESNSKHDIKISIINDLQDINTAIHLLKHDSVHGKFNADIVKISNNQFSINGQNITYISERDPKKLPWKEQNIDLVMECTGVFTTKIACLDHISAGAKKVLISCPATEIDKTIVFGVNNETLTKNDVIISNASCTTNCLAPIVKILQKEFKIKNGFATTVHSYTGDQRLVDMCHKDLRRARAASISMIPTSTGATKTIEEIFPELKGKLSGLSIRVPTANVSMLDFTFTSSKKISIADVNNAIIKYANSSLKQILAYTNEELISTDFNHSNFSAIVDLKLTQVIDEHLGHIVAWYDNEWGFSNRMLDVAALILQK